LKKRGGTVESELNGPWERTLAALDGLAALEHVYDGDGDELPLPCREGIERARIWLARAHDQIGYLQLNWVTPHMTSDEDGDICLEWWGIADRKITVYVAPETLTCLKISNSAIEEIALNHEVTFVYLWKWLHDREAVDVKV
jgi:hypothetical protein